MSASRELRESEKKFNEVIQAVRNMDKLMWLGNKWNVNDVREYSEMIASAATEAASLFANEVTESSHDSAEITLFKNPNDPNERVNKPNYNPPSFEDFDK